MRLFVAVDLDDAARASLEAEQARLAAGQKGGSRMRWVRPVHLHLTLAFLGEVSESQAAAAAGAMAEPFPLPPFDIAFQGLGAFPARGAPRTLWIAVAVGESGLRALARGVADRLGRARVPFEDRPFGPHLTLARWKTSRPSDRQRLADAARPGIVAALRVEHATLYSSQLSSDGPRYTALARANLTARG
jgi:2'-5' RNA ligase